jgi:uncharacterized integral membrane protein
MVTSVVLGLLILLAVAAILTSAFVAYAGIVQILRRRARARRLRSSSDQADGSPRS